MIKNVVNFCVRERLVVFLVTLAVVVYGWYSFREVPIDAIPNVSENQVIVLTEWSGRSPKDIEDQITYPLSIALQSVAGAESCLLYTSPSPRDATLSRMPSSA